VSCFEMSRCCLTWHFARSPRDMAAREFRRGTLQLMGDIRAITVAGIERRRCELLQSPRASGFQQARLIQQALARTLFIPEPGIVVLRYQHPANPKASAGIDKGLAGGIA